MSDIDPFRMSDERTPAERLDPEEHIDKDDPRYDGFRIREYWMLTAIGPDNQEAPVLVDTRAAYRFHLAIGPAMAADQRRLLHLREFAAYVASTFSDGDDPGLKIRHFVPEGQDEEITP